MKVTIKNAILLPVLAGLMALNAQAEEVTTTATPVDVTPTVTSETPATTEGATVPSPTFDMRTSELRIPCLAVTGIMEKGRPIPDAKYDVVMKQRGQSSNWEITFASPGCAGEMPAADTPPVEDGASTTPSTDTSTTGTGTETTAQ